MTWDAYNRRMPVLREVLAVADRRRDITVDEAFEIVPEAKSVFDDTNDLLLDAQMLWFQRLSGQMERQLTEGSESPEMTAIDAWMTAAADMPGARALLDAHADRPELAKALSHERAFIARAAGVPIEHPELEARGQRILDTARDAVVYAPLDEDRPEADGFMARLRHALAA
jgi:hypothetical protein